MKPSIPKGTRDFGPEEVVKRQYIFDTIRETFVKYGYQPLETPVMEELSTLTGKYGDEGDKLVFKILNNGDFLEKVDPELQTAKFKKSERELEEIIVNCLAEVYYNIFKNRIILNTKGTRASREAREMYLNYVDLFFATNYPKINQDLELMAVKSFFQDRFEAAISEFKRINSELNNFKPLSQMVLKRSKVFIGKSLKSKFVHFKKIFPKYKNEFINSNKILSSISKRGLRYDLTVPFARYVVMNQHLIHFPFKRYQIQPVWRADRPQKGRYQEFYQCDVDVVGSDSLMYEAELVQIYDEVFAKLGLKVTIKINNRKILFGMAEAAGIPDQFMDMTVAIDKLDKVGMEGVRNELLSKGITAESIAIIETLLQTTSLAPLKVLFANSPSGLKGIEELENFHRYFDLNPSINKVEFDIKLARGLSYYTGCIFEVITEEVKMGSIGGGGRYDDLTGVFGLKGVSGVGVSFGADRIYDVMDELKIFPDNFQSNLKVMLLAFDEASHLYAFNCLNDLRKAGINADLYPSPIKFNKQMKYANDRKVLFTIVIGDKEMESGLLTFKDMQSREQEQLSLRGIIDRLS